MLLFLATALNYLGRQTISVLGPALETEMHRDNPALGWLLAEFYYSFSLAHFVVGPLLDRSNLRWAFGLGVLVWALAGDFAIPMTTVSLGVLLEAMASWAACRVPDLKREEVVL